MATLPSAVATVDASSSAAVASAPLAPGFRFHPTDEELVFYYLKRKVLGRSLRVDAIAEVDLYKIEPWDLPELSRIQSRDLEWYFFSPLDRKYSNRSRTNRATGKGYWKTTGKDRAVCHGVRVVGMKKTLVFHVGRAPKGERTNWVMHEYRLEDEKLAQAGVQQDGYVVCRIFQKSGAGPQNGAKYGAPYIENEWDEEEETTGLAMLPVGIESEVNEGGDDEYLQFDEFVRNQAIRNQDQVSNVQLAGSGRQDDSSNQSPRAITLEEELEDPKFVDEMVDFISRTGPEIGNSVLAEETQNKLGNDHQSQSPPNRPDEYLEINDLINNANVICSGEESDNYPLRASFTRRLIDGEGEGSSHLFSSDNSLICDRNEFSDESDLFRLLPAEDNLFVPQNGSPNTYTWPLWNEAEEDLALYDAPNEFSFTDESLFQTNEQNSLISQPSSLATIDDFMVYFDATDNLLRYDTNASGQTKIGNMVDDSSSEKKGVSYADIDVASSSASHKQNDIPSNDTTKKTSTKNMINLLGSISAPYAFASESPPRKGKIVEQGTTTSSSIHVTAGVIEIRGLAMAGMADNWFFPKSSKLDFLLSCSMADASVGKLDRSEPIINVHAGTIDVLLGGGFYLFFVSAILLAISYKLGMVIYSR